MSQYGASPKARILAKVREMISKMVSPNYRPVTLDLDNLDINTVELLLPNQMRATSSPSITSSGSA